MKKTIAAILIIAMIAVVIALPSFASDSIYFTSVNNILMPLSDETMPISYNDTMYVPYSVFNSNDLGTFAVYSQTAQIVTVFGSGVQLYYDMFTGTTYDTYGNQYRTLAISSNGRVYLPAAFTCDYFGINYSAIYGNKYGTIIRMTVGTDVLDNDTFSKSASALMKSRLNDYNRAKATAAPTASPSPTAAITPSATPSRSPQPYIPPASDHSDVDVYLSFLGLDPDITPRILNSLQLRSAAAAFFVSADDIAACPELVRQVLGSGHMIGLVCGGDELSDYAHASDLLFEAAHTTSFVVAAGEAYEADTSSGLIVYCDAADARSLSLSRWLKILESTEKRADLVFTTDEQTASTLPSLLRTMRSENYNIKRLTEFQAAEYSGG